MFILKYKGGVAKPDIHMSEKFMLFFLIGEQEIPFYQMLRDGQATRVKVGEEEFATKHRICKLFVSRQGFGIARQYHSFYLSLETDAPTIEILPFSEKATGFYLRAKSKLLERKEVLEILPEKSESKVFVSRQEVLPLDLARKMVHIDKSELKVGVRHVKIGHRKGGE